MDATRAPRTEVNRVRRHDSRAGGETLRILSHDRAQNDLSVSHIINIGERLTVTGNTAHSLFSDDSAEFVSDGRREKELAVEKAAKELSMPINFQNEPGYTHPAFNEFPDAAPIKGVLKN